MSGPGAHAGSSAGDAIKKGVGLVHGAGEAIRGNLNAAVDSAAGDREGVTKNETIASRGADEMDHGYHHTHGTGAGVTPVDTASGRPSHTAQGGLGTQTGSTNYGPHDTNLGNKVDPRFDSDLDHSGYQTDGSSNYGPHSTNTKNKFDPRYDSDLDHRGLACGTDHSHYGLEAGSTNYGPHRSNIGNKLDPRYDSDLDHRGPGVYGGDHSYRDLETESTNYGPHSSNTANKLDPRYDSDQDHRGAHTGSSNYGPHSSNIGNKLDPRYDSDLDHRGAHGGFSHYGPHSGSFGSKMDPSYDSVSDHRNGEHQDRDIGISASERAAQESIQRSAREHAAGTVTGAHAEDYQHVSDTGSTGLGFGPHKSSTLNMLDPRIDSSTGKRRF